MPTVVPGSEYDRRIAQVIDYIFKHSAEDISVDILASVAHYSPDHFQMLFKQAVGETPKQFSLKLRLETAFLYLIIHPQKHVWQIALDCGFSSAAVFSRAMRNCFGHSPGKLRSLAHRQQMAILHNKWPNHSAPSHSSNQAEPFIAPEIHIVQRKKLFGIYKMTAFDDAIAIRSAFRDLMLFARTQGVLTPSLHGILSPFRGNSYRAFLPIVTDGDHSLPSCEIPGGTFAGFSVSGDLDNAKNAVHYFAHRWLPVNGYKVAGFEGFETFTEDPAGKPYFQLRRQVYIPIEPAR